MSKQDKKPRKPWTRPELRRIEAGAAEGGFGAKGDGKDSSRS
ncbi:MAG TPA: hypothetical protein VNA29_00830 [Sphingomicrobium sp.]|nr:hypothetical protein [Sphingomicrobium sp.]